MFRETRFAARESHLFGCNHLKDTMSLYLHSQRRSRPEKKSGLEQQSLSPNLKRSTSLPKRRRGASSKGNPDRIQNLVVNSREKNSSS
jgi:hypothetical protein